MKGNPQSVECAGNPKICTAKRRRLVEADTDIMQSVEDPETFCSITKRDGEPLDLTLAPFVISNQEKPGVTISTEARVAKGSAKADRVSDSNGKSSQVWAVTANKDPTRVTCCGNKFKTESEKFFGWAAQVGGMAGLIHSIFFAISSMDIGAMLCKKKNEEEAEENENGIEMTNDNM